MEKLLVKAGVAADIIDVCRSQMYKMIATGEIPSVRIGRSIRVPREALERWVKDQVEGQGDWSPPYDH